MGKPLSALPKSQGRVLRYVLEIRVGGEQDELIPDTQLGNQGVDRTGLNTSPAALISKFRRGDMIFPLRGQHWKSSEVLDDLKSGLGTREPLEQLLKYEPGGDDPITSVDCADESPQVRRIVRLVPPQKQRPHAGIYEQSQAMSASQERVRSPL